MKVALSLENIGEASQSIDPVFLRSPQFVSAELSGRLGRETVIKIETLSPIKSFKGRGAGNVSAELFASLTGGAPAR